MGAPHLICSNGKWSSATYASTKLRKNHFFQGNTMVHRQDEPFHRHRQGTAGQERGRVAEVVCPSSPPVRGLLYLLHPLLIIPPHILHQLLPLDNLHIRRQAGLLVGEID